MPIIATSTYRPHTYLGHHHVQTVYPTLFRRVPVLNYQRQRLELDDGDFLDLDWSAAGAQPSDRVVIMCHGLESSSNAHYIRGMTYALNAAGVDVVCMNFRGCSGEPNRLLRSYHSGVTEDLRSVLAAVRHADLAAGKPRAISLIGFSLGGNVILKCLGEGEGLAGVMNAVVLSVPCDLASSATRLMQGFNQVYMRRFIKFLVAKLAIKNQVLGAQFDLDAFRRMRTFAEFDAAYTAPQHGYASAAKYWQQCSSRYYLSGIRVPTLLLNAGDDPFLTPACYPWEQARDHAYLHLEVPRHGGHVGFIARNNRGRYWHEERALAFLA